MKTVFDFTSYQSFLLDYFQQRRGNQSRLAEHIDCRSSFLTQVIDQKVELSLEQALKIPDFLGLDKNEKLAFTLLVQKEKIQDSQGKKFLEEQIKKLNHQNKTIKGRLESIEELSDEAKAQYYSSWIYGAIHILCAFEEIRDIEDLSRHLKIEPGSLSDCVQFLLQHQLLEGTPRKLKIGKRQIHLGHDSKYVHSHHINWRLKAIEKLSLQKPQGTHFSSLIGISKKDADRVQEILLQAVADINQVVQKSGEEAAYVVNLDFFGL
jgi:uncharacterized protein (TIGR02147 family)